MIKHIIICFCTLSMVASVASAQEKYTIKGVAGAEKEGQVVYLYQTENSDGVQYTLLDSARVRKGAFKIKGMVANPHFAKLEFTENKKKGECVLILEKGVITVDLDSDRVGGTRHNTILDKYQQIVTPAVKKVEALSNEVLLAGDSPEAQMAKLEGMKEQFQEAALTMKNAINTSIEANLDNMVSGLFLMLGSMINSPEKMDLFLAKATPECMENGFTKTAVKQVEEKRENLKQRASNSMNPTDKMEIGKPFLDGKLKDASGKETLLSAYLGKGKYVLIDFWASWCAPCRREMPNVKAAYEKYKDKGFEVLSVSVDKNETEWKKAIQDMELVWPQVLDVDASEIYGVQSIPYTFLVAPDGTVVAKKLRGEALEQKLSELIK